MARLRPPHVIERITKEISMKEIPVTTIEIQENGKRNTIAISDDEQWKPWAGQITQSWQKCVEGIVETGKLLLEAKATLKHCQSERISSVAAAKLTVDAAVKRVTDTLMAMLSTKDNMSFIARVRPLLDAAEKGPRHDRAPFH